MRSTRTSGCWLKQHHLSAHNLTQSAGILSEIAVRYVFQIWPLWCTAEVGKRTANALYSILGQNADQELAIQPSVAGIHLYIFTTTRISQIMYTKGEEFSDVVVVYFLASVRAPPKRTRAPRYRHELRSDGV